MFLLIRMTLWRSLAELIPKETYAVKPVSLYRAIFSSIHESSSFSKSSSDKYSFSWSINAFGAGRWVKTEGVVILRDWRFDERFLDLSGGMSVPVSAAGVARFFCANKNFAFRLRLNFRHVFFNH